MRFQVPTVLHVPRYPDFGACSEIKEFQETSSLF